MKNNNSRYGSRLIVCLAVAAGVLVATGAKAAAPANYKQRFAIAISGGASKGAYEAGLNWGLIKVLAATSGAPSIVGGHFYPAEIESVTGASAGGINSLLSALAWCTKEESKGGISNTISNNVFRDTWLLPDVNQLLPADPKSPIYRDDDAMLSRKTLLDAAEMLKKKWHSPAFRPGCQIKLGVTVTRVKPQDITLGNVEVQNQRFYFPFEFYVNSDGRGRFRFDPDDYAGYWDPAMILFPRKKGMAKHEILDEQIEAAVLTSSAFPVAFGRKRLLYCRLKTRSVAVEGDASIEDTSTRKKGWRCPSGYVLDEAEFADGGLFDNLPIGLARILAEKSRTARKDPGPIAYIYLDPNRTRYAVPDSAVSDDCASANPPAACDQLEYSFSSESSLLLGALGTARKYELYRELLSENWALNLSEISYAMANELEQRGGGLKCSREFPYFDREIPCVEAMRRTGQMLEIIFDHRVVPVTTPFSVQSCNPRISFS
jgi:predicted acylesterase/phospholipase RssA